MKRNLAILSVVILLSCLVGLPGPTSAATITFDGLDTEVDATGVTIGDVTFRYQGPYAVIGDYGPIPGDSILFGESVGLLFMDFGTPIAALSFEFALDTTVDVDPGVTAELIQPGQLFGDLFIASAIYDDNLGLALGTFNYAGAAIAQAILAFDAEFSTAFIVDNVNCTPVPLPGTLLLFASGLAGTLLVRKRARS